VPGARAVIALALALVAVERGRELVRGPRLPAENPVAVGPLQEVMVAHDLRLGGDRAVVAPQAEDVLVAVQQVIVAVVEDLRDAVPDRVAAARGQPGALPQVVEHHRLVAAERVSVHVDRLEGVAALVVPRGGVEAVAAAEFPDRPGAVGGRGVAARRIGEILGQCVPAALAVDDDPRVLQVRGAHVLDHHGPVRLPPLRICRIADRPARHGPVHRAAKVDGVAVRAAADRLDVLARPVVGPVLRGLPRLALHGRHRRRTAKAPDRDCQKAAQGCSQRHGRVPLPRDSRAGMVAPGNAQ